MEFAARFAFYKDSRWKSTLAQYVWSWSQTLLASLSGLTRLDRAMESPASDMAMGGKVSYHHCIDALMKSAWWSSRWGVVSSATGVALDALASSGVCGAGDGVVVSGGVGGRRTAFPTWEASAGRSGGPRP
ncbi:UNVERIFIED_CONTAM: hypothetical protein Sindi_0076000 [Sesamum indicum]